MILRTILVGVGGSGQWAVDVFGRDLKFNPIAIVDANATASKVAKFNLEGMGRKGVAVFSGLTGALSQMESDAVVICTPTASHADYCHMAFSVGQHVLVENCMTADFAKARELVEEAKGNWSKFCVMQRDRYSAVARTVADILKTADHPAYPGEPKRVEFLQHSWLREGGMMDETAAGLRDLMVRHADLLAAWLGPAKRVSVARFSKAPWTSWVHDSEVDAVIEHATGAVVTYSLSFDSAVARDEIIVEGERGALAIVGQAELYFYPRDGGEVLAVGLAEAPAPEQAIADDWFKYIVEDIEPQTSGRVNLQSLAAVEMIYKAGKSGRAIERADIE